MKKTDLIFWEEPLAGYSYSNILRLFWQNRFRMHLKYLPRLLYSIIMSTLLLPFRIKEMLLVHSKIKQTELKEDPVFIVGHYRTGTTYLITLLSKDQSRGYCSNVEAYLPHIFLGSPGLADWIIGFSVPETRPMDNVIMTSTEPTEEEYMIGAADKYGYYNGFLFPRNFRQYSAYNSFDTCKPGEIDRWWQCYEYFVKKLSLKFEHRQLFLKNPANTYRIRYLTKKYPNAKWIHIYRNPYHVFASTVKFYRETFALYSLQSWDDADLQKNILQDYQEMYTRWFADKHLIPTENLVELRYEEFIQKPMETVEYVYKTLRLSGFDAARPGFQTHVDAQRTYQPNVHTMSDDVINQVNAHLADVVEAFEYTRLHSAEETRSQISAA